MKKILPLILILFVGTVSAEDQAAPKWRFSAWARDGKIEQKAPNDAAGTWVLDSASELDFCSTQPERLPVAAGNLYEFSAEMKMSGPGQAGLGIILYDGNPEPQWSYAHSQCPNGKAEWTRVAVRFLVPKTAEAVQVRVTGQRAAHVEFRNPVWKQVGKLNYITERETIAIENSNLKLEFLTDTAGFRVTDKRTNRVWEPTAGTPPYVVLGAKAGKDGTSVEAECLQLSDWSKFRISVGLEKSAPEILVRVSLDDPARALNQSIPYPRAFVSQPQDRIILPVNEGISFPAAEPNPGIGRMCCYGGHGLCMAFWGQTEDKIAESGAVLGGSAYLAVVETPDDAQVELKKDGPADAKLLSVQPLWEGQCHKFGYDRAVRYVFFENGGHVALCKRYREYVKQTGLYVPFREKIRRNPKLEEGLDLLFGSVNVWYFGGDKIGQYKEMQSLGIDRILASAGGTSEELRTMNSMPGILTSRYDIYQDAMDPAAYPKITNHTPQPYENWTWQAWERDDLMLDETGDWRKGWQVDQKDKTQPRIPCGVLCDKQAPDYERERVAHELETCPYRARFIDTTTASPWRECYHPRHPMTRSESKFYKMELLGILGREFNLVTGSETGHEASVPFCDFYEGMMSLGPYRVPDSGRYLTQVWEEVPERVEKYQVGEAFRLPLWELVYHDCTVSYWYWGDYNNKLPKLWDKRDLFNALYGVPPMFLFTKDVWEANKDRFVQSYRVGQPVSRMTACSEMTDHRILTPDRTVQQSRFANGVVVTVNFGSEDYKMSDGFVLKTMTSRVEQVNP